MFLAEIDPLTETLDLEKPDYKESALDYLRRCMEVVELEFKVKEDPNDGAMEMIFVSGSNTACSLGIGSQKDRRIDVRNDHLQQYFDNIRTWLNRFRTLTLGVDM